MSELCLIVAMARNRVIGIDNRLPWRLKADLQHFKATTLGHPVVMGRKTWESIGRPLPGRINRVVTRNADYVAPGAEVHASLDAALAAGTDSGRLFVIGGGELYAQALPLAQRLYVTLVEAEPAGDAWFPVLDPLVWQETARSSFAADEANDHPWHFVDYVRR